MSWIRGWLMEERCEQRYPERKTREVIDGCLEAAELDTCWQIGTTVERSRICLRRCGEIGGTDMTLAGRAICRKSTRDPRTTRRETVVDLSSRPRLMTVYSWDGMVAGAGSKTRWRGLKTSPWSRKRNHLSFMNKSFNTQCNLTKFSILIANEYCRRCNLFNFWNLY